MDIQRKKRVDSTGPRGSLETLRQSDFSRQGQTDFRNGTGRNLAGGQIVFRKSTNVLPNRSSQLKPNGVRIYEESLSFEKKSTVNIPSNGKIFRLGRKYSSEDIPVFFSSRYTPKKEIPFSQSNPSDIPTGWKEVSKREMFRKVIEELAHEKSKESAPLQFPIATPDLQSKENDLEVSLPQKKEVISKLGIFALPRFSYSFAAFSSILLFLVLGSAFLYRGYSLRGQVLGVSKDAYGDMITAVEKLKDKDLQSSEIHFQEAYRNFSSASEQLNDWAGVISNVSKYIPFASGLSSGKHALEAGKRFASAGEHMNSALKIVSSLENPFQSDKKVSILVSIRSILESLLLARKDIDEARMHIDEVRLEDLPDDKKSAFVQVKNALPEIARVLEEVDNNSSAFIDMLGGNGPRKYLFLFQNNHEMRPTGGFIGSYGFMDVSDGVVRKFFVNGIFDPDGQLKISIVPPKPIQKISAAWSLHDSNWFSDFPLSAAKAMYFYEKTGGPTVDGVIAITPELMRRLLEITGPISMEKYDTVIDSENFIENIQQEVEIDYDKVENKPKQILSDLAPVIMEKTLQFEDFSTLIRVLDVFVECAREKHVMLYSSNSEAQDLYSRLGWTGEVRNAPLDFVQVVNANVNGYKTDGVIDEQIEHSARIDADGSVVDTLAITRTHKGGDLEKQWWNHVNADYMRVYLPKGAEFLSVEGQTREFEKPPIDYDALGFTRDVDLENMEKGVRIDTESGTRISEESGKTVFGNWVYVSPKEKVTIKYTYRLPFRVFGDDVDQQKAPSYSLLAQKQSGSMGSRFSSTIVFPESWGVLWKYPDITQENVGTLQYSGDLRVDGFISTAFQVN